MTAKDKDKKSLQTFDLGSYKELTKLNSNGARDTMDALRVVVVGTEIDQWASNIEKKNKKKQKKKKNGKINQKKNVK